MAVKINKRKASGSGHGVTKRAKTTKPAKVAKPKSAEPTRRSERIYKRAFHFMELPQELQDMVYDEVWKEDGHILVAPTALKDMYHNQLQLDYEESIGSHTDGLPQWLLTNKAIYEKGLKQLRAKSKLSWTNALPHKKKMSSWLPEDDVTAAAEFNIQLEYVMSLANWLHQDDHTPLKIENQIRKLALKLNPDLEVLNITISVGIDDTVYDDMKPWFVDLPYLETQSGAKLKEINVRLELLDQEDEATYSDAVLAALEESTILFGTFFGVEGTLESKSEPLRRMEHKNLFESAVEVKLTVIDC